MQIGIDIGGTSIKGGLVDNGQIVKRFKTCTDISRGFESLKEAIFKVVEELLKCGDVDKIGISSAGDINPITGEVIYATNVLPNYIGQNVAKDVQQKFNLPTFIMNDAMCALVGEMFCGVAVGYNNVLMLTLGTGVGGEVAIDKKVLMGEGFRGSRLGHIKYNRENRACACGEIGCVECFISATGLIATAKKFGVKISDCNQLFNDEINNDLIIAIVNQFTTDLAKIVDMFAELYNVDIIVIGGGLINTAEFWWQLFLQKVKTNIVIKQAQLKNDAGIIGATIITEKKCF
ncbi:MAG: ROK family protein [Clostridia bacterium]